MIRRIRQFVTNRSTGTMIEHVRFIKTERLKRNNQTTLVNINKNKRINGQKWKWKMLMLHLSGKHYRYCLSQHQ